MELPFPYFKSKCTDKPIWNLLYSMNANYSANKRKLNKRAIDNLCKQENLISLRPTVVTEACKVKRTPYARSCTPTPKALATSKLYL